MKRIIYVTIAIILFACKSSTGQSNQDASTKNIPPLYSVSDIKKRGLNGKIKTIITKDYWSAELKDGKWVSTMKYRYVNNTIEKFNEDGHIIWSAQTTEMPGSDMTNIDTTTYHYSNNQLKTASQTYIVQQKGINFITSNLNVSYDWVDPYSYKKTTERISNGRVQFFIIDEFKLDQHYHLLEKTKITKYDPDSDVVEKDITKHTYNTDYSIDTTKNEKMEVLSVETIQERDKNGNPSLIIHEDSESTYIYSVYYEYYQ